MECKTTRLRPYKLHSYRREIQQLLRTSSPASSWSPTSTVQLPTNSDPAFFSSISCLNTLLKGHSMHFFSGCLSFSRRVVLKMCFTNTHECLCAQIDRQTHTHTHTRMHAQAKGKKTTYTTSNAHSYRYTGTLTPTVTQRHSRKQSHIQICIDSSSDRLEDMASTSPSD